MVDQFAQFRVVTIQRIVRHKIHISVSDRNVALGIHRAEVTQFDGVRLVRRSDVDRAHGIVETVLAQILSVFNDEGNAELLERREEFIDRLRVHGERFVRIVDPVFVLVEGEAVGIIFPRQRLNGIARNFQHDLVAVADLLLAFFESADGKCDHTCRHQNTQQNIVFRQRRGQRRSQHVDDDQERQHHRRHHQRIGAALKRQLAVLCFPARTARECSLFHQLYLLFSSDCTDRNRKNAMTVK